MKFSVLIPVYMKDKDTFLDEALKSIVNQTVEANEIIIVQDGPISKNLESVINRYLDRYPNIIKKIALEENVGLGVALNIGLEACTNELVARMDSDDICVVDRFEKQLLEFEKDTNLDLIGSSIYEFYDSIDDIKSVRNVPSTHEEIVDYVKKRNPFNHMTVMFKKSSVINSGSYKELSYCEDYYLWIRMIANGCKVKNITEPLVYARTGSEMFKRRGGINYVKSEVELQKRIHELGITNKMERSVNTVLRSIPRVLPNRLREFLYLKLLRK